MIDYVCVFDEKSVWRVSAGKLPAITQENAVRGDHGKDFEEKKAPQVLSHWMGPNQEIDQS